MNDVFKEQLIKRKPNTADTMKKVGIIFAALIILAVPFFVTALQQYIGMFYIFLLILVGFGVYMLFSFFNIEYEYAYTNGELDIDIIYSKSRRKRVFSGTVKDFEIMVCALNKEQRMNAQETRDYSSGTMSPNVFAFLTSYKGKRLKILIEPNEKMLAAITATLSPRKFIKNY